MPRERQREREGGTARPASRSECHIKEVHGDRVHMVLQCVASTVPKTTGPEPIELTQDLYGEEFATPGTGPAPVEPQLAGWNMMECQLNARKSDVWNVRM